MVREKLVHYFYNPYKEKYLKNIQENISVLEGNEKVCGYNDWENIKRKNSRIRILWLDDTNLYYLKGNNITPVYNFLKNKDTNPCSLLYN